MQSQLPRVTPARHTSPVVMMLLFGLMQFLIIGMAFLAGFFVHRWWYSEPSVASGNFPLVFEAYDLLKNNAYFNLPTTRLMEYGMIRGMLTAVNEPYTVFVEPPQHQTQSDQLKGKFGGIGVRLERDTEGNILIYPLPGSPAQKAGVQDGDRLLAIETLKVTGKTTDDEIHAAISGPVGKPIKITVGRSPDYRPIELTIERAEVALPSTTWNLAPNEPRVGIVHILRFAETTPGEVTKGIKELQAQGASRLIIDVRNNGGGLVEAGVDTARLFLTSGQVMVEQYRGKPEEAFNVDQRGEFADLSMVVLINKGTASAAEIFAGAIKAQKRAPVVGTRTYGKDTIQLIFGLSDGSSLHVTAAHWWVPGLSPLIGGNGVQPDVLIDDKASDAQAVQKAIETVLK